MNHFWQKEGAWKKFILSLICDIYKSTFMYLYPFYRKFWLIYGTKMRFAWFPSIILHKFFWPILSIKNPWLKFLLVFWCYIATQSANNSDKMSLSIKFSQCNWILELLNFSWYWYFDEFLVVEVFINDQNLNCLVYNGC